MAKELKELREKQRKLVEQARELNDKAVKDEARAAEYEAEHDTAMAEWDKLEERAERLEKLLEREERTRQFDNKRPKGDDIDGEERGHREPDGDGGPEYKDVFVKALRYGAASLNAEERSVLRERGMSREARAQAAGTPAAGGYTVPQGFSGEIERSLKLWGPMLDGNVARSYPTGSGNPIPWPTLDYTGKQGELKAENAAATDDGTNDAAFGQKVLNAYLYDSQIVRVSLELLEDSAFNIEELMSDLFGESLGRKVNADLTTGDDNGKPNGIVTAASQGIITAAAAAVTSDELIDFQHSVDPAYRQAPGVGWMFNDTFLKLIRKLKDGQGNYLWQMGDIKTGAPATLLDKPYYINQAMANPGAGARCALFGDLKKYVVRRVGNSTTIVALRERYAERLQVGFIGFLRVDGELLNSDAVKYLRNA